MCYFVFHHYFVEEVHVVCSELWEYCASAVRDYVIYPLDRKFHYSKYGLEHETSRILSCTSMDFDGCSVRLGGVYANSSNTFVVCVIHDLDYLEDRRLIKLLLREEADYLLAFHLMCMGRGAAAASARSYSFSDEEHEMDAPPVMTKMMMVEDGWRRVKLNDMLLTKFPDSVWVYVFVHEKQPGHHHYFYVYPEDMEEAQNCSRTNFQKKWW
jgi:hypothetical protein